MAKTIGEIIQRYYDEADGGMVEKAPSALKRGEGTEKEFFIYKIDLVGSTFFTMRRSHQTYLKLAHTFLSTVDEITRYFGADGNQAEYAGDSVIAYFPKSVEAVKVLAAAYYCRLATLQMKSLDASLNKFPCNTKAVVHFGKLIIAKVGPYGDSFVSAIGPALHKACKMENDVPAGEGHASKELMEQLQGREKSLLQGNYKETQVPIQQERTTLLTGGLLSTAYSQPSSPRTLLGMSPTDLSAFAVNNGANTNIGRALNALATPSQTSNHALQYETRRELINYSINWDMIPKFLVPGR
ncbi:MAG TPA: adenylate cyclase [Desulfuromonadales bacterium]|nr:adenylate cyclase [Desulfuromonadales bacterium]